MNQNRNDVRTSRDKQITIAFYALVLVFALATNVVLTYLLFTRKFMKSKYIFTASISVSHIIMCVVVIPLAISYYVTSDVNVRIACDVTVSLCVGVTTQSMLATSVRRALAISERFRHANFTYRGKVKNIACLWIVSLGLAIPYSFNRNIANLFSIFPPNFSNLPESYTSFLENSGPQNETAVLVSNNESIVYQLIKSNTTSNGDYTNIPIDMGFFVYDIILMLVQMILPIIISLTLQTMTLHGIRKRPNQTHWVKEIMITKQHIAVATIFFICWFPGMVTNVLSQYIDIAEPVYRILHPIAISAIVYFPLIYYKLNAHIKREFRLWLQELLHPQPEETHV